MLRSPGIGDNLRHVLSSVVPAVPFARFSLLRRRRRIWRWHRRRRRLRRNGRQALNVVCTAAATGGRRRGDALMGVRSSRDFLLITPLFPVRQHTTAAGGGGGAIVSATVAVVGDHRIRVLSLKKVRL